jgi:hypothetical protein
MSDNGSGVLQIGINDAHEVVVNLPHDMTGHIVFSPQQARGLADTLIRKAVEAEAEHRAKLEAARIAAVPPVDRSKVCTTSGAPADQVRAEQTEKTGQHGAYIVLCADERAKGFVRPYRDAYKHVGQRLGCDDYKRPEGVMGGVCLNCGHTQPDHVQRNGACNAVTTMGRALSETYARDPKFYGSTFCVNCNRHLPVAEFIWTADGQQVGS